MSEAPNLRQVSPKSGEASPFPFGAFILPPCASKTGGVPKLKYRRYDAPQQAGPVMSDGKVPST
jgi:hypothetical protein